MSSNLVLIGVGRNKALHRDSQEHLAVLTNKPPPFLYCSNITQSIEICYEVFL